MRFALAGLLLVSVGVGSAAGSTIQYTVTDLGGFGAEAINDNGQVVGYCFTSGSDHAFLYSNGIAQDMNTLIPASSGWTLEDAYGINDSGQVVGTGVNPSGQTHAFLYQNGTVTDLGTLGGGMSEAYGINASGQVVGDSTTAAGADHAFIYSSSGGMKDIGALPAPYNQSEAFAINAAGQVVGGHVRSPRQLPRLSLQPQYQNHEGLGDTWWPIEFGDGH